VAIIVGLVFTAIYILRVFSMAFFGPVNSQWDGLRAMDLKGWQLLPRAILVAVLLLFGFFPRMLLDVIDGTTTTMLAAF
jgi:NADH-quinone oxidoreductase subunit M